MFLSVWQAYEKTLGRPSGTSFARAPILVLRRFTPQDQDDPEQSEGSRSSDTYSVADTMPARPVPNLNIV